MSDQNPNRSTADWLVDLCVYAPIGFVLDAPKYVPEFVDRGRNQVALARFLGKFAVDRLEKQFGPLGSLLHTAPPAPAPTQGTAPAPAPEPSAAEAPAPTPAVVETETPPAPPVGPKKPSRPPRARTTARPAAPAKQAMAKPAAPAKRAAPVRRTAKAAAPKPPAEPTEGDLAISGYGTLAASQIVPRLTTLSRAELDAIGRFERANRARRTILNRVDQLLADR